MNERFFDHPLLFNEEAHAPEPGVGNIGVKLPRRYFSIRRTIKDIPAPQPCPCCENPTRKAIVPYWVEGSGFVVGNNNAPGYQCTGCGAGLYDPVTDIALLAKAAERLDPIADSALRASLYEATAKGCQKLPIQ